MSSTKRGPTPSRSARPAQVCAERRALREGENRAILAAMMELVSKNGESDLANRQAVIRSASALVPLTIQDAGSGAVESYLGFFAQEGQRGRAMLSQTKAASRLFFDWCREKGLPLAALRGGHASAFLAEMQSRYRPSTLGLYAYALRRLFTHLESDAVIEQSSFRLLKVSDDGAKARRRKLKELNEFLDELDGYREGSDCYRPGLVAMYPVFFHSMDTREIAATTGIGEAEVQQYAARLRKNGIWREDGKIAIDKVADDDVAHFTVEMVLIIGCAAGIFEKVPLDTYGAPFETATPVADGGSAAEPESGSAI